MAISAVQTSAQVAATGASAALTLVATGAGNLVVVHINTTTAQTVTGVTDNASNTYAVSAALDNGADRAYQAYGVQVAGGATTVTVTFSASVVHRCGADEYSGAAASNVAAFDASTTGTGTGTAVSVSTLTPAETGELIVVTGCTPLGDAAATWTAGTGYTLYNGSGAISLRSQYKLSGDATETAPWTLSSSLAWRAIATAFKPAPKSFLFNTKKPFNNSILVR